jgi:hypothetical protein
MLLEAASSSPGPNKSGSRLSVEIRTETEDPEVITCGGLGFINSSAAESSS